MLAKKLAEVATDATIKKAAREKEKAIKEEQQDLEETKKLADALAGKEIVIKTKAKEGKLFGSVTAKNISEKLIEIGFSIKEQEVIVPNNHIKNTGTYPINIQLYHGISSSIKVVIEESEPLIRT